VKIRFLTIAQQEVDDAFRWFEDRTKGAGVVFLDELDRVIQLAVSRLLVWKSSPISEEASWLAFRTQSSTGSMVKQLSLSRSHILISDLNTGFNASQGSDARRVWEA